MHLGDVVVAWDREVSRLDEGAEDVLALDLSHLLFVLDAKVLANELGVECDDLNDLVPKLEELTAYLVEVLHELERDLVRVTQVYSLRERHK